MPFCGKYVATVQTQPLPFGSFQDLSSSPALLAAGVTKPSFTLLQHFYFIFFWQTKIKVRPACCWHLKFSITGTLQSREQKKAFEQEPKRFCSSHKENIARSSLLRTSFLSVPQLKLCTHVCLRSSYFRKAASSSEHRQ